MSDPAAWVGAIAAVFSAAAAGLAAWAAVSSKAAASKMVRIETARRRQELTPRLSLRLVPLNSGDPSYISYYNLSIELLGPVALKRVTRIAVRVRDDQPGRDRMPVSFRGEPATAAQLKTQIWGPLRFTPNLHHGSGRVDSTGRYIDIPDEVSLGDSVLLQLEPTPLPPWSTTDRDAAQAWWRDTVGTLVRLTIELWRPTDDRPNEADTWVLRADLDLNQVESPMGLAITC